jgi:hypothetical protein
MAEWLNTASPAQQWKMKNRGDLFISRIGKYRKN